MDPRAIDTILVYLLRDLSLTSNETHQLSNLISGETKVISLTCSHKGEGNGDSKKLKLIEVSLNENRDVGLISIGGKDKVPFAEEKYMAFPSIKNARYLINTSQVMLSKGASLYLPGRIKFVWRRWLAVLLLRFGYHHNDVVVRYPESNSSIRDLLKFHAYTGVYDGKRSAVYLRNDAKTIEKIAMEPNSKQRIKNEYIFLKKLREQKVASGVSFPMVGNQMCADFTSFEMSVGIYRRPFVKLIDLRKAFTFLHCLQTNARSIFMLDLMVEAFDDDPAIKSIVASYLNCPILCSRAHGDFTPWNLFIDCNNDLYVFDFELGKSAFPIGYDIFCLELSYCSERRLVGLFDRYKKTMVQFVGSKTAASSPNFIKDQFVSSALLYLGAKKQLNVPSDKNTGCAEFMNLRTSLIRAVG